MDWDDDDVENVDDSFFLALDQMEANHFRAQNEVVVIDDDDDDAAPRSTAGVHSSSNTKDQNLRTNRLIARVEMYSFKC